MFPVNIIFFYGIFPEKNVNMQVMQGNYTEIRKSLAHIDWNDKMKNKTATECWNIFKGEIDSAKRSKKKHLSKEAFRKIRHKKVCGGFINIRERIKIMWFTKRR